MDAGKALGTDKWYRALPFIAGAVLVGVVAVGDDPALRKALIWLSVGAGMVGIGEWMNHEYRERMVPGGILRGHPWSPTVAGVSCVVLGLVALGRGLWLLW